MRLSLLFRKNSTTDYKSKGRSTTKEVIERLFRNKAAVVGLVLFILIVLVGIFAPLISPHDPYDMDFINMLAGPSKEHPLGCDDLGRDILARIIYGTRYSVGLALITITVSAIVGTILGALAGYFGGWVDTLIMRTIEILQSIPSLLLSVAISILLGTGFINTIIALSVTASMANARIMRGSVMSILHQEYLEAAEALNCPKYKIILKHVLPNSFSPLIVRSTQGMASAIMNASTLSFIGLGILPPTPEWGAMLSGARKFIRDYPHLVLFPGLAIVITVFSLSMLGDGLRDALDPKMKD